MCVIYMKTKCHCDMVMLFPCVNLTNADIQRAPHPTTRLSVSAQTFDLYLFFVILILSCHHSLPPPSPPPPFMCPNRIGCEHTTSNIGVSLISLHHTPRPHTLNRVIRNFNAFGAHIIK